MALWIQEYSELDVQRHAMYCLWMLDQSKVHIPPAWLTASRGGDWLPTVLHFRIDENTFMDFTREVYEEKQAT